MGALAAGKGGQAVTARCPVVTRGSAGPPPGAGRDTELAMSRENVGVVRAIYEAVNRGDWDAALRDQRPDVELTTPPRGPNAGTYRGREEI
jgi:hypothetical protein